MVDPNGQRNRVPVEPLPFQHRPAAENHLIIRDSRVSRTHARIVVENGDYVLEDCGSRHGTFVNGKRVTRHALQNSDRIEFGSQDSYQLVFALRRRRAEAADGTGRRAPEKARVRPGRRRQPGQAARRSWTWPAPCRARSRSTTCWSSVVDTALAITGAERGFLLLRTGDGLETRVARARKRRTSCDDRDLRVPRRGDPPRAAASPRTAVHEFRPARRGRDAPQNSVADLELRSVICVPLVRIRAGQSERHQHAARPATRRSACCIWIRA